MLLRKVRRNALPLFIREPKSFRICRRSTAVANFELGRSRNGICRAGSAAAVAGVGEPSVDGFVAGYAAYRFTHGVMRRAVSVGV